MDPAYYFRRINMGREISISVDEKEMYRAIACFASPAEGIKQQGQIRMISNAEGQQGKHVLYMLAQRALIDFDEKVLPVISLSSGIPLEIPFEERHISVEQGAVLAMNNQNQIKLFIHKGVDARPMLVAFHRMATHMIRLDVP